MGDKQSEHAIVSRKMGNSYPGDPLERRACQTIELQKGNMKDISRSDNMSTRQLQIAELSKMKLQGGLTSLNKHIDFEWMREAWRRTRKNGATGIDRMSTADFEVELGTNLTILLDDVKSGRYSAPPVRRVEIPKEGNKKRLIGIPTTGDKVAQQAIFMLLEPVYEQEFLPYSYGFRKGRSCHMACADLREFLNKSFAAYVVEADISQFFDKLDHGHLKAFLRKRINDGVVLRLIDKWLKAGVMDGEIFSNTDEGTPQGGIVSPLAANVFLHYVLDLWFQEELLPQLSGEASLVRYCDDFCIVCRTETDANKVLALLYNRFTEFGLTLHPEKTRLVPFRRPFPEQRKANKAKTQTFDFLGFTFYWGRSQKGKWVVKLKTSSKRFRRGLKRLSEQARLHMHDPIRVQLNRMVSIFRGHENYYGVVANSKMVGNFRYFGLEIWRRWLCRRSSSGYVTLERMSRILALHSYFKSKPAPS